ncbi:hypothetical protein MMC30_004055 [Trapelia coarctata]|nr:hypothetical protein [Trapelia coarctata]
MAWLSILISIIVASALWLSVSLFNNYNAARQIGFPIILSPVSALNPLWILTQKAFPVQSLIKYLPFGLGQWARVSYIGWTFQDKYSVHMKLGDTITVVNPSYIEIFTADPDATHRILARRTEYIKPAMMYEQMDVFGRSLNTVEGDDWQRHRRLTAPSFNEKTSSLVWNEASTQAQDMQQLWLEQGSKGTIDTVGDTATLTLHVLASAGFGIAYPFRKGLSTPQAGHSMTYRDSLLLILQNIITLAILPKRYLTLPIFPQGLRRLGQATQEFKRYMEEMLDKERSMISKREPGTGNLVSALIRASEDAKQSSNDGLSNHGLADDEIYGNIFIYNLAGHETTANTLAFAITLLAAFPQRQDWIAEELDSVLGDNRVAGALNYEDVFPKLNRCLAVMFETLRLYGSIIFIPKTTGSHTQTLDANGRLHVIPSGTFVNINSQAVHTHPNHWGPDPLLWRPSRWLAPGSPKAAPGAESLIEPAKGTFIPWADGPRVCPGRKFAQVEFVAAIATLFHRHTVEPNLINGESPDQGRKRLMQMIDDSAISAITLQMRKPRSVALKWQKRPSIEPS